MNTLPPEKRCQIIQLLVEGNSLRSCSRLADVSINTVTKLLVETGKACKRFHNKTVIGISPNRIQCDEIWSFIYAKQKNSEAVGKGGDVWIWVAMDTETKLVISWHVGNRDALSAKIFMKDLSEKLIGNPQLSTDGFIAYREAVRVFFDKIDYGQVEKIYGRPMRKDGTRDNRIQYIRSDKTIVSGNPDRKHISTSYIERQNLTMRMHMRRFTRKTNAFSKKLENHCCAIALHYMYYNFVRIHKTLRITPAMAAGLTKRFMSIEEIVNLT